MKTVWIFLFGASIIFSGTMQSGEKQHSFILADDLGFSYLGSHESADMTAGNQSAIITSDTAKIITDLLNYKIYYPAELDIPYSFDNPPCKIFTPEQIRQQIADGERIHTEILAAEKAGKDLYVIPPGDYRFNQERRIIPHQTRRSPGENNVWAAFYLDGIKRPDDKPFVIRGKNVIFWTPPNENGNGNAIYLNECENIAVVGITVDSDVPNTIEGRLTSVDRENNRIEIELLPGTLSDESKLQKDWSQRRIIPYKANGRNISEIYSLDGTWGPGFNFITSVEKSDTEARYWLTFRQRGMVDIIDNPLWEATYGEQGTLKTGDGISLLYGTGGAFTLYNCKKIIMKDLTSHIAKFAIFERGGYGAHLWINVKLMRRPGSNQLLGGDGTMFMALRHGSTYDGLVIGGTSDDAINLHGYMGFITGTDSMKNSITVNRRPQLFLPGDCLEFYNINTGELSGRVIATQITGNEIVVKGAIPVYQDSIIVRYPEYECADWTIKNSTFYGPYQRILIQTGPGVFENNICRDLGSPLALHNHFSGLEGGMLHDVKVRNNIFIDCASSPNFETIRVMFVSKSKPIRHKNIEIKHNVILGSGSNAIRASETDGLVIEGNIMINPMRATALLQPEKLQTRQAIRVENSGNIAVINNYLFEEQPIAVSDKMTNSKLINGLTHPVHYGNKSYLDNGNAIKEYVYRLFDDQHLFLDAKGLNDKILEHAKHWIRNFGEDK